MISLRVTPIVLFALLTVAQITMVADTHAQVFVRVNQVGYSATGRKIGIAFSQEDLPSKFEVINSETQKVVFEGNAVPIASGWGQFAHHADLDFTSLKKSGHYVVRIGSIQSPPFEIIAGPFIDLPDQLLEFMRQQRCGYNPWLDAKCHQFDGKTAYGPLPPGSDLNCTGGWHDAGDLLKYLLTSSNATAQMLLAYKLQNEHAHSQPGPAKSIFADRFNARGQPGANGVPDILDEARWGLDWMLKLHPAPDQLYHQVADDRDHKGWRLPQNEIADYGWGPGCYRVVYAAEGKPQGLTQYKSESTGVANLAGRYAAAMALGYQIWKNDPKNRDYAETLLRAGKEVYSLGKAKEGVQQGNSYSSPYRYEETTWADDMEWGAAELYRATREPKYMADAKRYARIAANDTWMGKEQTKHYQYYPFMNLGHFRLYDLVEPSFQKSLAGYYKEGVERCVRAGQGNPYRVGVPFIWCSNNLIVALATQALLYQRMTGDTRYAQFTAKQCDWLLGRNPWGFSMFTMVPKGGTFPSYVHLFTTAILKRQVRGGLVDGPVYMRIFSSLKGVEIRQPDPLAPFQDDRAVYHDDIGDYSTNEPTMDGTASAILLWALLSGKD
jgi:endoglucanase